MDTTTCILEYNVITLSTSLFCLTCKFQEEEETLRLDTGSQMMLDGQLDAMEKGLRLVWFSTSQILKSLCSKQKMDIEKLDWFSDAA